MDKRIISAVIVSVIVLMIYNILFVKPYIEKQQKQIVKIQQQKQDTQKQKFKNSKNENSKNIIPEFKPQKTVDKQIVLKSKEARNSLQISQKVSL